MSTTTKGWITRRLKHLRGGCIGSRKLTLIAVVLATLCSPLRAGEPVDTDTLQLAQRMATQEWKNALPFAMLWHPAERQMPSGAIGTMFWFNGVAGFVASDLRATNPGREADILVYINSILIPEMNAHRDAYVCGYTRQYYSFGKQWLRLQEMIDGFPDPFAPIAYFIVPTRDYLRAHNLALSSVMLRELERNARFAPDGSFWQGIAASRDHIPCDSGADGARKSFGVQL